MKKRLLAILLTVCMVLLMAPVALAADGVPVAEINGVGYKSLQAAIDAAADGAEIDIIADFALAAQNAQEMFKPAYNRESYCGIYIPDDKAIVLDLNGHTVSYEDAYGDVDNVMVLNLGNLTINDSEGGGKLTYKPVAGSTTYSYFYSTIFNCGTLTINAGTIENTAEAETDVTNAVDNHSRLSHEYGNDCVLNVNGGTLNGAYYYAIRQYTHYFEGVKNRVTINNGAINGGIYMQHGESWYYADASKNRLNVDCYLTINGGVIDINNTPDQWGKIKVRINNPDNNAFGLDIIGGTINVPVDFQVQRGVFYTNGVSGATTPAEAAGTRNAEWLETNGGFITGGTFASAGDTNDVTTNLASFLAEGYALEDNEDSTYGVIIDPEQNVFAAAVDGVGFATLQAAIEAAEPGDTVTLLADVILSEPLAVSKTIVLNLNGKTITGSNNDWAIKITSSTLTLADSSTNETGKISGYRGIRIGEGSAFIMNGGSVITTERSVQIYGGTATMNAGLLKSTGSSADYGDDDAVQMYSVSGYRATFIMNGGSLDAVGCAIKANGSDTWENSDATINGGTLEGDRMGIYWPAAGKLTIAGGTITGPTAVYMKSGSLEISDGTLNGTGSKVAYAYMNSGADATGDALVIENVGGDTGYEAVSSVSITGGTFSSESASAVASYTAGNEGVDAVAEFISGGTYSDNSAETYLADGYTLESYVDSNGKTIYGAEPIVPTYTVTYTDGVDSEEIFKDQSYEVEQGSATPSFAGTPTRFGYIFTGWTPEVSATVTGDATYTAVWQENNEFDFDYDYWYWSLMMLYSQEFDVTATAAEGGVITPAGVSKVKYDKNITYTITPDEGYVIADVLVNGESVGAVSEYTIKRVKKDQTIHAIFVKTVWENPFTDIAKEAWYYEDIEFVSENGLMIGTGDDKFSPNTIVNRAMLVTVLWRLEGSPVVDSPVEFFDVPADEWYSNAVAWASANGIVNGYGNGIFGAADDLTHEQIMAILNRYAVYKQWSENVSGNADDSFTNSEWAESNILWADLNGMFDGIGSDISNLTEGADRAELAAYLRRFCEKFMAE